MTVITDEQMFEGMKKTKAYCACILRIVKPKSPEIDKIIWEHGRRNFSLRADGLLSIVCPIADGTDAAGLAIFNLSVDETKKVLDGDPGVMAGVFTYELHPCRSFPGDALPS